MKRDKTSKRFTKRLYLTFSDGKDEYNGVTSNISQTGLFIRTRKAFPPGTNIRIVLELDEKSKISLEGVVAWALRTGVADFKNGMGVRLKNSPDAYKELLKELSSTEV